MSLLLRFEVLSHDASSVQVPLDSSETSGNMNHSTNTIDYAQPTIVAKPSAQLGMEAE
jgi:hypothetical protein